MNHCLKTILFSFSIFWGPAAFSAPEAAYVPQLKLFGSPYVGGKVSYAAMKEFGLAPEGRFIEVPLDYKNPARGNFDMFYRLSPDFDPQKPTVLFFNGGPGSSSDSMNLHTNNPGFNFIYFDQRGTSYSHLRALDDLLNPDYFSSELIARDAEFLRAALGVDKISVYGHSYGTVPATIYSHLFAAHTTAVVLEGVIFDGTPDLWNAPYRLKQIQKFYDSLPAKTKQLVQRITDFPGVPKDWFYQVTQRKMYDADFAGQMIQHLEAAVKATKGNLIKEIQAQVSKASMNIDSIYFGAYMYNQIGCQELSMSDPASSWGAVLKDGKFIPSATVGERERCFEIPGMGSRTHRTYYAKNYPLSVPVLYIEGTTDGATAPPNAMRHFKQVAQGRGQLLFAIDGGHTSALSCAVEKPESLAQECPAHAAIFEALQRGFLGENIDQELLKKMSADRRWVKGSKLRSKIPTK